MVETFADRLSSVAGAYTGKSESIVAQNPARINEHADQWRLQGNVEADSVTIMFRSPLETSGSSYSYPRFMLL